MSIVIFAVLGFVGDTLIFLVDSFAFLYQSPFLLQCQALGRR